MECRTVKNKFSAFVAAVILISSNLNADVDFQDIGPTNIDGLRESDSRGPFKIELTFDAVAEAKIRKCHHHLQFATGEAEISAVFYYDPCIEEGASIGISYSRTRINWMHNHWFHQKDFDEACLTLGFTSKRLCDWLWQIQLTANFDNIENWSFNDYMNYDMLLWGRYEYFEGFGVNIGFIGMTGMKIDRVYPIIGVDWKISEKWQLNLVFPVNVALVYNINEVWSVDIAGRLFNERHRLKRNERLSKGLIEYYGGGGEFGLNYHPTQWLAANIHAGYSLGAKLKVSNRHHNRRRNYNVDGAPYAGAELDFAF